MSVRPAVTDQVPPPVGHDPVAGDAAPAGTPVGDTVDRAAVVAA